jgi:hypothetical protein
MRLTTDQVAVFFAEPPPGAERPPDQPLPLPAAGEFEAALAELREHLTIVGPVEAFGGLGFYRFTRRGLSDQRKLPPGERTEQFHMEFLQAVALTSMDWQTRSLGPTMTQLRSMERTLVKTANLAGPSAAHESGFDAGSLVGDVRTVIAGETRWVRNWANPETLDRTLHDLFAPLDQDFAKATGVGLLKLVDLLLQIPVQQNERHMRFVDWHNHLLDTADSLQALRAFQGSWPGLKPPSLKKFAAAVAGHHGEEFEAIVNAPLKALAQWTLADLVALAGGANEGAISQVVDLWSLKPGAIVDIDPKTLLANPVWRQPFVKIGDASYVLGFPGLLYSFGLELLESAVRQHVRLSKKYSRVRSRYLENEVAATFAKYVPRAKLWANTKWRAGVKTRENDLTVRIDDLALVVESKSQRARQLARRGLRDPLATLLDEVVVSPTEQAEGFIAHLQANQSGARPKDTIPGPDVRGVLYFLPVAVTLENLGALCTDVKRVAVALNLNRQNLLAQTLGLVDLQVVFEILGSQSERVHYLWRRRQLERRFYYVADELDLLAMYFNNQLAFSDPRIEGGLIQLYGRSEPINRWLDRAMGIHSQVWRPRRRLSTRFRSAIDLLERRRRPGWLRLCLALLDVPDELQRSFEKGLRDARRQLRRRQLVLLPFEQPVSLPEGTMIVVGIAHRSGARSEVREFMLERTGTLGPEVGAIQVLLIAVDVDVDVDVEALPYTVISFGARTSEDSGNSAKVDPEDVVGVVLS